MFFSRQRSELGAKVAYQPRLWQITWVEVRSWPPNFCQLGKKTIFWHFPQTPACSETTQAGTGQLLDVEHNAQTWPWSCMFSIYTESYHWRPRMELESNTSGFMRKEADDRNWEDGQIWKRSESKRGGGQTPATSCFDMVESEAMTACGDKGVSWHGEGLKQREQLKRKWML